MRKLVWIAIPLALLASAPAFAQGTPEQRAACNDDAFRFCNDDVPDAIAVERCLRAHMSALSAKVSPGIWRRRIREAEEGASRAARVRKIYRTISLAS